MAQRDEARAALKPPNPPPEELNPLLALLGGAMFVWAIWRQFISAPALSAFPLSKHEAVLIGMDFPLMGVLYIYLFNQMILAIAFQLAGLLRRRREARRP